MDNRRTAPEQENESEMEVDLQRRMNELDQKLTMFRQNDIERPKQEKEKKQYFIRSCIN